MRMFCWLFSCTFFVFSAINAHDYYIGLFEWHQTEKRHYLKISLDTEDTFQVLLSENKKLKNNFSDENIKKSIQKYLQENLQIWINQKHKTYQFTQLQIQDDFIRVILDVPIEHKIKKIHIKNTCLVKYFASQQNVHKFFLFHEKKFVQLTKDETELDINY